MISSEFPIAIVLCLAFAASPLLASGSPLLNDVSPEFEHVLTPSEPLGPAARERVEALAITHCDPEDLKWLSSCPRLTYLKLGPRNDQSAYSIDAIKLIATCKSLKHLSCVNTPGLSEEALAILMELPNLETLSLAGSTGDTDGTFGRIRITGELLGRMTSAWPKLRGLDIALQSVASIPEKVSGSISHLKLCDCQLEKGALERLLQLPLTELDLRGVRLTAAEYEALGKSSTILALGIEWRDKLSLDELELVLQSPSLIALSLSAVKNLSDAHLELLSQCKSMVALDISAECPFVPSTKKLQAVPETYTVSAAGFAKLAAMPSLAQLVANTPTLNDAQLTALAESESLRDLNLHYAESWTARGMAALKDSKVEVLNLSGGYFYSSASPVDDSVLDELRQFKHLRVLDISFSKKATSKGMKSLVQLVTLEVLEAHECEWIDDEAISALKAAKHLKKLKLSNCRSIGPAGLVGLSALNELTALDLSGCPKVDNSVLDGIAALPALRSVNLSSTGVKGKTYRAFWDAMIAKGAFVYPYYLD